METTWLVVLLRLCVQIFAGPIYLLWYLGIWGPLCKKFFPYFMASVSVDYNKRMFVKKKELFSNLNDFSRPAGTLRLLEIGTGTGTNFQFYPTGCRITCTDPNPNFDKFLAESLSQNPHLQVERCLVTPAEDLHEIPDASVDVVVCTLVLCSVKSIEGVVVEVLRVLRPGGAFYFLEHVADAPSSWTLFWQQVCEPTWRVLFDGCHLTRETWKELEKAGFSEMLYWRSLLGYHRRGSAGAALGSSAETQKYGPEPASSVPPEAPSDIATLLDDLLIRSLVPLEFPLWSVLSSKHGEFCRVMRLLYI